MAISFREYPWYLQALVFVALALLIIGAGEYIPGSPVTAMRTTLQADQAKDSDLNRQVAELQVYERRNAEFKLEMAALEKQLDTLKTIVPEDHSWLATTSPALLPIRHASPVGEAIPCVRASQCSV